MNAQVESVFKQYWPKALEVSIVILFIIGTMQINMGNNNVLIERNHEDIVMVRESQDELQEQAKKVMNKLTRVEASMATINARVVQFIFSQDQYDRMRSMNPSGKM